MKLYKKISTALAVVQSPYAREENIAHWAEQLKSFEDMLPSGSGFDNGTKVNREKSTPNKIILDTAFHHMDQNGFYCGWSDLTVTINPSLLHEVEVKINFHGYKRAANDKEFFYDTFYYAIAEEI